MKFNLLIEKDGDGYLAKIDGYENLYAFSYSEKEAVQELKDVVEMMMDFHMEQANDERLIRDELASTVENYAVQV
jgi:predicted RNase H-like HicB family nuclease